MRNEIHIVWLLGKIHVKRFCTVLVECKKCFTKLWVVKTIKPTGDVIDFQVLLSYPRIEYMLINSIKQCYFDCLKKLWVFSSFTWTPKIRWNEPPTFHFESCSWVICKCANNLFFPNSIHCIRSNFYIVIGCAAPYTIQIISWAVIGWRMFAQTIS